MKRVVFLGLACVLATCQYGWAYQPESPQPSDGLIGVLAEIIMAPCGLLAACLGMDGSVREYPYPCGNTYGSERKVPRKVAKGDSSTRIKKIREEAETPSDRTPPVRWHRPPSDRPETQASAPPLLIPREIIPRTEPQPETKLTVPGPQPVAPAPPVVDVPVPRQSSPVPGDRLPPQRTVKPPETPLPPARVIQPKPPAVMEEKPPAAPPKVVRDTPKSETPKKETLKPELEKIAPPASTAPPKTEEPKQTEKKRQKSPCGPVYQGCYPGYYWR